MREHTITPGSNADQIILSTETYTGASLLNLNDPTDFHGRLLKKYAVSWTSDSTLVNAILTFLRMGYSLFTQNVLAVIYPEIIPLL